MTTRGYNIDEEAVRQAKGSWFRIREQFIRVLRKNPNLLIGLIVLIFFSILCGAAQFWERIDPLMLDPDDRIQGPSWKHWFGTDYAGRDIFFNEFYPYFSSISKSFLEHSRKYVDYVIKQME